MQAIETDAVIIGAGPVGLFQAFELGLLEIQSHIIDALPEAGGQCGLRRKPVAGAVVARADLGRQGRRDGGPEGIFQRLILS